MATLQVWVSGNAIALWGAVLSTVLAAREIWRSRSRIHFNVNRYRMFNQPAGLVLVTEDVANQGGDLMLVVNVYNRSRDPIHLEQRPSSEDWWMAAFQSGSWHGAAAEETGTIRWIHDGHVSREAGPDP